MIESIPREVLRRVRKLAQLPQEVRQCRFAISITRLTVLKSLCQEPEVANRFVTYLARKTLERVKRGQGRSGHSGTAGDLAHRRMMTQALTKMKAWMKEPTEKRRQPLVELLGQIRDEQQEYEQIRWGSVRLIHDWDLLLFEHALSCLLYAGHEAGYWAYHMARDYAERYDARHGSGLIPASAPQVQDIADFWIREFGLDAEALSAPAKGKHVQQKQSSSKSGKGPKGRSRKLP